MTHKHAERAWVYQLVRSTLQTQAVRREAERALHARHALMRLH
ncbi:MAG: hypothetical protein V9E81_12640 [Marmoricola sp.]|jgi:hypothetical protein